MNLFLTITPVLSYWLNYGVRNYQDSMTWRFPIAFQILLALVYVFGLLFLPESPRWSVYPNFNPSNTPKLHSS